MKDFIKKLFGFIVFDILETVVVALAIFVVVYVFIASPHIIVGHSMDNSFANGEFLLINKVTYRFGNPARGDVIIFKYDSTHDYIKRILGLPGDTVEVTNGSAYINGEKVDETAYLSSGNETFGFDFLQNGKTITVPANHYFVMGDNRENSSDSRQWGFVDRSAIDGKAWLVYWPVSDFKLVPSVHYVNQANELKAIKN